MLLPNNPVLVEGAPPRAVPNGDDEVAVFVVPSPPKILEPDVVDDGNKLEL